MNHFKNFTWMFQLNLHILNWSVLKVIFDLELCDKWLIKQEQSHCYEKVTVIVTQINGFVYFSESSIFWIVLKLPLKVEWLSKISL